MSFISSFVANHLLTALESELENHAPEIEHLVVSEIGAVAEHLKNWVESKVNKLEGQSENP